MRYPLIRLSLIKGSFFMPAKQSGNKPAQSRLGKYVITAVTGEAVRAYIPVPLPPDPPVDLRQLHGRIERADRAVGRLDGLALYRLLRPCSLPYNRVTWRRGP